MVRRRTIFLLVTRDPRSRSQSPDSLVERISRIRDLSHLLIERELAARGIRGVLPAHGGVLAFLFRQTAPVPIKDLVAFTGRAKSTVTGVVQTLERHGYLERLVDQSDSRVWAIRLTSQGRALRADFEEISRQLLEAAYGRMAQQDRETLIGLLAQIEHNLGTAHPE